jgi:predicted lipid-binding transport protein (Tim44 family)
MRRILPVVLVLLLAVLPASLEARPGLGGSMGSRGSATWSSPSRTQSAPMGAMPMQRSATPNYGNSGYSGYGNYGSAGFRRPFMGGMMGGLLGAGLLGMLIGGGFFGFHGGMGFLGLLIQLALLFFVGRWIFSRMFGAPAFAGGMGGLARGGFMQPGPAGGGRGGAAPRQTMTVTQADYQQFTQLLLGVQAAWSRQDINGLQSMATPEMVGYFNEQLSDLSSRGQRNEVRDVRLLQGDLSESWTESGRDYATVSLKFSVLDATFDRAGNVVDGSTTERVTVTEFWTFVRRLPGHWILSAIQQAR